MPSGAKKRKAAKKKLQKAHNGAHPQASDDPRSHIGSDGGDVDNHEEGTEEIRPGEENEAKKVESEEKLNDISVESEEHKSSSGSSSSSSSDSEEIVVEKEKSVILESRDESLNPEVVIHEEKPESLESIAEDNVSTEISVKESVPNEDSVKQVVSLPEVVVIEEASERSEEGAKQSEEEVLPELDEKEEISSIIKNTVEEKCDTQSISVVERVSENFPEPVDITVRANEALLPPSSGVTIGDRNGGSDHNVKESEKQPLVSSVPVPVRRTSWMDCCGLFEVVSGGSSR